jgi:bifunctional enzyme CysN/CysC
MRHGLNRDLGFTKADRIENMRRIGDVSSLMVDAGLITLAAFISPYRQERQAIRDLVGEGNFVEIFVNTPLEVCEDRDVKGLYAKARRGELKNFTGIDSEYQDPETPDIDLKTTEITAEQAAERVVQYLQERGYLHRDAE